MWVMFVSQSLPDIMHVKAVLKWKVISLSSGSGQLCLTTLIKGKECALLEIKEEV